MEGESGVTRRNIDEFHSSDIQGYEMEGERAVTRNIIDELHSWNISKEIKWKVNVVLLEV